ncbi:hypothetical protein CEXT_228641 [Caerostris extrusa]|uniref:Uncharacterized protein n=1 Tax=Caerostris extrusa TaxID=172846 RepID=A0AAV4MKC7_CAEEX|nr:hypothetical protein CEXT_228641 [Caerostris extrusa]
MEMRVQPLLPKRETGSPSVRIAESAVQSVSSGCWPMPAVAVPAAALSACPASSLAISAGSSCKMPS